MFRGIAIVALVAAVPNQAAAMSDSECRAFAGIGGVVATWRDNGSTSQSSKLAISLSSAGESVDPGALDRLVDLVYSNSGMSPSEIEAMMNKACTFR